MGNYRKLSLRQAMLFSAMVMFGYNGIGFFRDTVNKLHTTSYTKELQNNVNSIYNSRVKFKRKSVIQLLYHEMWEQNSSTKTYILNENHSCCNSSDENCTILFRRKVRETKSFYI